MRAGGEVAGGTEAAGLSRDLRAPYPYFGGKSRVAALVWSRLGNVPNYCEPFFGSGAVLLARPHRPRIETVNDKDAMIANFWRALQADPEAVASYADWPVNECDQHARHLWLVGQHEFRERMLTDPDYYDAKIAGWWVWGQSMWIGSGWCASGATPRQRPHLGDAGTGVHRKRPHLGDAGRGVHRKRPHLTHQGNGVHAAALPDEALYDYLAGLAARLRRVRVCCGDWSRICGPTPTVKQGLTGVFLDPPYATEGSREGDLYAVDDGQVAAAVREWALTWGDDPRMRIALCSYDGDYAMPASWECVAWKAHGGYGNQGEGRGRENAGRERVWFSPFCLRPERMLPGFGEPLPLDFGEAAGD